MKKLLCICIICILAFVGCSGQGSNSEIDTVNDINQFILKYQDADLSEISKNPGELIDDLHHLRGTEGADYSSWQAMGDPPLSYRKEAELFGITVDVWALHGVYDRGKYQNTSLLFSTGDAQEDFSIVAGICEYLLDTVEERPTIAIEDEVASEEEIKRVFSEKHTDSNFSLVWESSADYDSDLYYRYQISYTHEDDNNSETVIDFGVQ